MVCAGRQTGKSTIIAAKALHFAVTNPKVTVLIVSATLRQSILMFNKVLDYVNSTPLLKKSVREQTRTRIKFSNGSEIIALPCGRYGRTLRGHTAHLIICDEAAFMPEEVIAEVVLPMISTTNGFAWLLSTPWDQDHIFWKAYQSDSWSKHHWSTDMNPLVTKEFLEEQKKLIGEERFMIEYMAIPVEEKSSYFPMKLLRSCCEDYEIKPMRGGVAGYDPGGKDSQAAFIVLKKKGDKIYVVYQKAEKGRRYTDFNVEIADFHKRYPLSRLYVDMTGLGNPIIEHLEELLGKNIVEGITLTDRKKEEVFTNLKLMFEQKKIMLPNDDYALLNALNAVTYERTRSGGYRFGQRKGTYDDLAYALALAAQHFKRRSGGIYVIPS